MATISEFSDHLPHKINEILKNNMLEKLDPELKKKLFDTKGDIVFDFSKNTFTVTAGNDELEKAIIADLKSKR
jgi:hypothetical protein